MSAVKVAYTLDEAAAASGISRSILERAIRSNSLIARYPTSRPVIEDEEFRRWLKSLPTEKPEHTNR